MKSIYKDLLHVSLSANDNALKQRFIKNAWVEVDEDEFFLIAKRDEVAGHVADVLRTTDLDYSSFWDEEYFSVEKRVAVLMEVLEDVAKELSKHDIEIVALKNAGITKGLYSRYACSPMGDLDLLVRSQDFHKAHEVILNSLGFEFKFRSEFENEDIEEAFRGGGTEYRKHVKGHDVWLELQWRPIAGRWIQPHNEPNGDELMSNSIEIKNSSVRILSPEDNLLQVALHTAKHSYVRAPGFRLHSDVDRVVRFQKIDWKLFVSRVLKLRLKTAVYFSLFYAKVLLDTPIPESVLRSLKPVWFRRMTIQYFINKAGIYNQKTKKFSRIGYIVFNLSLYDTFGENIKAIFPPFDSLKIKYPIRSRWQLPYYHFIRIKQLIFQRAQL